MKRRTSAPTHIRDLIESNLQEARRLRSSCSDGDVWSLLEEAHILSQPWAKWHIRVHGAMLREAFHDRDRHELLGQVGRLIVAGPGSPSGRYPVGNIGRATVSAFQPMPVPGHPHHLLED